MKKMIQEEKQLLIKDLCARLPYGVKFEFTRDNVRIAKGIDLGVTDDGKWEYFVTSKGASAVEITEIKPYLRPLSSMTEEEYQDYHATFWHEDYGGLPSPWSATYETFDWFNAHHFDFRGLISMGLAIEAPEEMYKK